jgi:2-polyprenyl-3-methyl-5-hydroxy-6-metoxy-1,4-benzoquinol methylase
MSEPDYQSAMARRLYRRAVASGRIAIPAVPSMIDEYVKMCDAIFRAIGVVFNDAELTHLRSVLVGELATAFTASPRSEIVITYDSPSGSVVNYHVKAEWFSLEAEYEKWFTTREPPFFGTEPDARVWKLSMQALRPEEFPILDLGAGTGRNSIPLARRGHPVDAIELTEKFTDFIRQANQRESLNIRVIQQDFFVDLIDLRRDYQLIIMSEVTSDFRTSDQLRKIFILAAQLLAPGGCLVFNSFLAKEGYVLNDDARQLGQQFYSATFTRNELATAATGLPISLISDEPVYEYEKANLPAVAWPPTGWYEGWVSGQDVFDLEREVSPIELRWLVYQKLV